MLKSISECCLIIKKNYKDNMTFRRSVNKSCVNSMVLINFLKKLNKKRTISDLNKELKRCNIVWFLVSTNFKLLLD